MEGDFSRLTFNPDKRFHRVLLQQGRVLVDADWNEQTSILLHYLRTLARHLIGPHGGPAGDYGFEIGTPNANDFAIGTGAYYVDGILCEVRGEVTYQRQPDFPNVPTLPAAPYVVYLDVWERHVTHLQDVDPVEGSIREVALGGPDTATRTRVVWQVRIEPGVADAAAARLWVAGLTSVRRGELQAHAKETEPDTDPCIVRPDARFRGAENQLYRVEIHDGGPALATDGSPRATFKWSRENGSVVFAIRAISGDVITLADLGRDARGGLRVGDWVELVSDDTVLLPWAASDEARRPRLRRIAGIDPDGSKITLEAGGDAFEFDFRRHPLVRRWDGPSGVAHLDEGEWLELEKGVEIRFAPTVGQQAPVYRPGDYWLIPARTATGDVEWPRAREANGTVTPVAVAPHGVQHRFAPLAFVNGATVTDLREDFPPMAL